ncbi:EamA family transporter [bacterium]|nr:EamA family transporter [bacterium]
MLSRIPPVWLVLIGIFSVQFGAGLAKTLFTQVSPTTVGWVRLVTSSVFFLLLARPQLSQLSQRSRADWLTVIGFGLSLGIMNWSIYQAFALIPIGLAVTLEFLGPLSLAVWGSRRASDLLWVALAGTGVLLLGLQPGEFNWAGLGFALLAGAAWAAYILLSAQTGLRWPGLDGLALASLVAALLLTPATLGMHLHQLSNPRVLGLGALVGLLSSVIPYSCELVALRRMPASVFSILMSLEPAAGALSGLLLLHETLRPVQLLAMACVVTASIGATRSGPKLDVI